MCFNTYGTLVTANNSINNNSVLIFVSGLLITSLDPRSECLEQERKNNLFTSHLETKLLKTDLK